MKQKKKSVMVKVVVVVGKASTHSVTWAAAGTGQGREWLGRAGTRLGSARWHRQSWPCAAS